jgi:gamma-glutamyltranspeptidase/glutathione hydrolase/leukotriene-C4 hydrolase
VKWDEPIAINLRGKMTLFSSPPPGSGILLGFILNILDGYNLTSESIKDINSTILTYHRIIEAFKFAYARRTELGDGDFVNITNVSILVMCRVNNFKLMQMEQSMQSVPWHKVETSPFFYGSHYTDQR